MKKKKTLRDYLGQVLNISPDRRTRYRYYVRDAKIYDGDNYVGKNPKIIEINGDYYQVDYWVEDSMSWTEYLKTCRGFEKVPEWALNKYVGI